MLGPLLLTAAGIAGLLVPLSLRMEDPPDAITLPLLVAGATWGWLKWRKRRSRGRVALASVQTLAALGCLYWVLLFSEYAAPASGTPLVGGSAPEISAVRVRDGATFHLAAQRGFAVLLVFFRGAW